MYLKSEIEQSCFLGKLNCRIPTTYNKFGIESALCHMICLLSLPSLSDYLKMKAKINESKRPVILKRL